MSTKHIALQARSENFDYTVVLERTPKFEALIRARMDLAATLAEQDEKFQGIVFSFYNFEVYEDADFGDAFDTDDMAVLDELPELGEPVSKDYGALVIDSDSVYLRFGIKHMAGLEETSMFESVLSSEKSS